MTHSAHSATQAQNLVEAFRQCVCDCCGCFRITSIAGKTHRVGPGTVLWCDRARWLRHSFGGQSFFSVDHGRGRLPGVSEALLARPAYPRNPQSSALEGGCCSQPYRSLNTHSTSLQFGPTPISTCNGTFSGYTFSILSRTSSRMVSISAVRTS